MRLLKLAVHLLEITPINAELMSNTLSLGEKKQQLHPYIITCAQVMIGLQFLLNMSVNLF